MGNISHAGKGLMVTAVLLLSFMVFLLLRIPVTISMGVSSVIALWVGNYPLTSVPLWMGKGVMTYTLMAVPFFIFAGNLMNETGLTNRIFNFARALVGHIRGGLAQVNILASMIFAGISGSFVADTAGLGPIEMKVMTQAGYDRYFSAAVTVSSSILGPIIPPSTIMIIYAVAARVSVARMFLAGIVPGVLIGLLMMSVIYLMASKNPEQFRTESRSSIKELVGTTKDTIGAVISPAIILFGMVGGIVTPTEAGILAIVWSFFVGILYKDVSIKGAKKVLYDSFLSSAHVMFLIALGSLMGWIISNDGTGEKFAATLVRITNNKYAVLFIINIIGLLAGCLLEPTPALLILFPIFEPIVTSLGIDLIHFGIILCVNLEIGMLTPPVGLGLYVISAVAKVDIERLVLKLLPFLTILILGLFMISFIPWLSLWLPNLLMPR
jgi:C4-dicarboxylate transporter, DctM subunit